MDLQLKDKVAIVTGGSKGIGLGVVRSLLAEGAKVANVNRSENEGKSSRERIQVSWNGVLIHPGRPHQSRCLPERRPKNVGSLWKNRHPGQQRGSERRSRSSRRGVRVFEIAGKKSDPLLRDDSFLVTCLKGFSRIRSSILARRYA